MGLLARIAKLVGTNLSELVEKADDPERLLQQVMMDMQNQLMQLKTQVAVCSNGVNHLQGKLQEAQANVTEWRRTAESRIAASDEAAARSALAHEQKCRAIAARVGAQLKDQQSEVERLSALLRTLGEKMNEARIVGDRLTRQPSPLRPRTGSARENGPGDTPVSATSKEEEIDRMLRELKNDRRTD